MSSTRETLESASAPQPLGYLESLNITMEQELSEHTERFILLEAINASLKEFVGDLQLKNQPYGLMNQHDENPVRSPNVEAQCVRFSKTTIPLSLVMPNLAGHHQRLRFAGY